MEWTSLTNPVPGVRERKKEAGKRKEVKRPRGLSSVQFGFGWVDMVANQVRKHFV